MGPLYYYWLTGKKRVLEDLITTERFLSGAGGTISRLPARVTSIPFMDMIHILEAAGNEQAFKTKFGQQFSQLTYPSRFKTLSETETTEHLNLLESLIRRYNESFVFRPFARETNYEPKSMMIQYASEACYYYWKLTQNSEASACVVNAKNYLYQILALPNAMPFYSKDNISEEWLPYTQETILPAIRAYQVTQDIRHLEQAKAPLDWELNYVGIARMSNAMSYGLQISMGVLREANVRESSLNAARQDPSTIDAIEQMKRAALPNLNSTNADTKRNYCTLAYEVARNLINNGRSADAVSWLTPWYNSPGRCSDTGGSYLYIDNFLAKATGREITLPTPP